MKMKTDPRTRYLNIATPRFAELGFHGVSLAALARDAGVSKQAFLHFFPTKKHLYAAALDRLADQSCASLETGAEGATAEERLTAHFEALSDAEPFGPQTAHLVIRALLDSAPDARFWPLQRYLDAILALARQTAAGAGRDDVELQAHLFQMLGSIHYFQISRPALDGMYGAEHRAKLERQMRANIGNQIRNFVSGA